MGQCNSAQGQPVLKSDPSGNGKIATAASVPPVPWQGAGVELRGDKLKQVEGFLLEVPLFNGFSAEDVAIVAKACEARTYSKDDVVIAQGDVSEEFFLIMAGEASVHLRTELGSMQVAALKEGDYFGEVALLHDSPRAATVRVEGATLEVLVLTRPKFDDLKLRDKLTFPCRKAVGAAKFAKVERPDPTPKTAEEKELIKSALKDNEFLSDLVDLPEDRLLRMIDSMWKESVPKGSEVIKQGDSEAVKFYVVQSGTFEVLNRAQAIGKRTKGQSFGELALLYSTSRAMSVRAKTDAEVWVIDRMSFKEALVFEENPEKLEEYVKLLGSVQMFSPLLQQEREALARTLVECQFEDGDVIMKEGDVGECMFLLLQGEVLVTVKGKEQSRMRQETNPIHQKWEPRKALTLSMVRADTSDNKGQHLASKSKVKKGDKKGDVVAPKAHAASASEQPTPKQKMQRVARAAAVSETFKKAVEGSIQVFGDRAMVSKDARAATVTAINGPVMAARLDVDSCNVLLGPLEDLLKRSRAGMGAAKRKFGEIFKSDLRTLGLLGCGGFGAVYLVENPTLSDTYALKAISKGYILQCGMQESVRNEKKILMMVNSPFIIKLYETYNGSQSLYFLMEAALGGELFATYNRKKLHGSTKHAQFYVAGAICAIEYLHSRRVVYRDLKPENLMITNTGHVKLIDMGLAKVVVGMTYTTCGTPDYFAPELLEPKSAHNHAVDWWTIGILTFELMSGSPPFESGDQVQTYTKIKKGIDKVPMSGTVAFKTFVKDLCQQKPEKRLGVMCGGVRKIREHHWFNGFSWENFVAGTMDPPYKPSVKGPKDVSNFKVNQGDLPRQIKYKDPGNNWDKDFATCDEKPATAAQATSTSSAKGATLSPGAVAGPTSSIPPPPSAPPAPAPAPAAPPAAPAAPAAVGVEQSTKAKQKEGGAAKAGAKAKPYTKKSKK